MPSVIDDERGHGIVVVKVYSMVETFRLPLSEAEAERLRVLLNARRAERMRAQRRKRKVK